MGVTPYSDTQQNIALYVASIKHHGSWFRSQIQRSERFSTGLIIGFRWMIHVLMMSIRLQSLND